MNRLHLSKNQSGIVSFFVVMIIMIVLTLIVLAFSQLVRREQRQSLDRQLKTQALYASESGVNDALDWLRDPANQADLFTWNNNCDGPGSFIDVALNNNNTLDPAAVISFSCLLVDPAPGELTYTVPTDESAILPLQPDGAAINSLRISWQDNSGGSDVTCSNGVGSYPGNGNQSCTIGTLRLEVLPFNGGADRTAMINQRFMAYSQPGGTSTVNFVSGVGRAQGVPTGSACTGGRCTVRVNNIPAMTLGYMRIGAIYRASDVTIEAFSSPTAPASGGTPLSMIGAQVEIDATGKANDVLHRIKVSAPIPAEGDGQAPEFALHTRLTQCKRFTIPDANVVLFPGDPNIPRCDPFQAAAPN